MNRMQDARDRYSPLRPDGGTQGPLGGLGPLLPDPRESWFLRRMRLHDASGHLRRYPALLWDDPQPGWRDMGLLAHLLEDRSPDPLDFTDILVIVNRWDWVAQPESTAAWAREAARLLREGFNAAVRAGQLTPRFPSRALGCRMHRDGDPQRMGGARYGLAAGQFITALLPNLYNGALARSRPILSVRLELRDGAEAPVEEEQLYSDQVELTVGNHWLDNVHHAALPEPAMFILTQREDGEVDARLNPTLAPRYALVSQGGADTQVHLLREGERTLARLVTRRMGQKAARSAPELTPTPSTGSALNVPWRPRAQLIQLHAPSSNVALRQVGVLVQRVHHPELMRGHDLYLTASGELLPRAPMPAATLQVRRGLHSDWVQLVVESPILRIGRKRPPLHRALPLNERTELHISRQLVVYDDLRLPDDPAWPYVGELRGAPGAPQRAAPGQRHRIGRHPEAWLRLPDSPAADNIQWREGLRLEDSVRIGELSVPRSELRTDAIGVGQAHAALDLSGEVATLVVEDPRCWVWLRRDGELRTLRAQGGEAARAELEYGDELLVGNAVLEVVKAG
ncbi:MAG: hypothetical protein H6740_08270 [Alphaproteobacteria bacterium]|nr:hypothetical protein [Alphaproteobacteria bacterium]